MSITWAAGPSHALWAGVRGAGIAVLALLQAAIIDRNYHFGWAVAEPDAMWFAFNTALKWCAYAALFGAVAFALSAFAQRPALARALLAPARWGRWLSANLILFAAMIAALPLLLSAWPHPPWALFALWLAAGAAMLGCAALAIAPARFWAAFAAQSPSAYALALLAGAFTFAILPLSQNSWDVLASATLHLAYAILSLYESGAFIDPALRNLGAGDFVVRIDAACSGYEGVGLVLTMLGAYLFAFRRDLRFPHVLLLLPIGVIAIWLSNALRIALLISLGAHVSPDMALNGFHAQAGWVMFLAVTISLMVIAHKFAWFRRDRAESPRRDPALALAAALLAPFAALMGARIFAGMFGPEAYWLAAGAIAAPALVIWLYRRAIAAQLQRIGAEPWLIGLLVGALWIATEPAAGESALGAWLGAQPPGEAGAWLALRLFGFALIVPIAEELAFRGYLHRALVRTRFEEAAPHAFSWAALIVTSVLFGAMHGRWLAGALAGAAFALTLYRSKTLAAPIAAHISANAAIAAYAIAMQEWALL